MKLKLNPSILFITCFSLYANSSILAQEIDKEILEPTEIYITGALTPLGLDRMGKPVSIITQKELQERAEPTIGEMLSSQPGVSSSYFGPGASRPIIRGQSKQRVRVIENGLENGDVSSVSEDHAVSVDPLSLQRVDVLRGPSTLLYGSSAIGGVVNMIDDSINQDPLGKAVGGELDLRKGDSGDEEGSSAGSFNGQIGNFNWHLSGFYRETDDIEIPGFAESGRLREMEENESETQHEEAEEKGKLQNSDTQARGLKFGTTYLFDKGYIGVAFRSYDSNYGVPGGQHHHEEGGDSHEQEELGLNEEAEEQVRIDLKQSRFESRGEVQLDDSFFHAIRFGATYSDYQHRELEGDETSTKFNNKSFEGRMELMHQHAQGFEGGMGSQIRFEDFRASGEEAFVPKSETFAPALFAVEDYKLSEKLVWQLGGRYEYANVNPENLETQDFNMFSASTGLVRNLDEKNMYSLGTTISYSERAPTSTELFADGAHLATQTFEIGDAGLDKERSVGAELVLRKSEGRLTGSSSLFWQHYFDYINLTPNGEEDGGIPVFLYGLDRARFWGYELEADYSLLTSIAHDLHLYGQIDYVRGENLSDSDPLPRMTPMRGKAGLKYLHDDFSAYVEGVFVAEQDRTADFELPTDSYALMNIGGSYKLPIKGQNTYEIYIRGTNLTDEDARIHNSFLKDVAPLRGRALLAGLRFNF